MSHESWGEATGEGTEVQRVEEASQVTQTVPLDRDGKGLEHPGGLGYPHTGATD